MHGCGERRDHAAASGVYRRDVAAVRNRRCSVRAQMCLNGEITPLRAASTGVCSCGSQPQRLVACMDVVNGAITPLRAASTGVM